MANTGCWNNPVPDVVNICFDWSNKRAHFFGVYEPNRRRCFSQWNEHFIGSCYEGGLCWMHRWHEVPCTW